MLQPNQAALLTLFGSYRDTDRNDGLRWENPFYVKKKVPVRARNFNSEKLKVNDIRGNLIEIAERSSGRSTTPHRRPSTSTTSRPMC